MQYIIDKNPLKFPKGFWVWIECKYMRTFTYVYENGCD